MYRVRKAASEIAASEIDEAKAAPMPLLPAGYPAGAARVGLVYAARRCNGKGREAVLMHLTNGDMTLAEIAARLGIALGSVSSAIGDYHYAARAARDGIALPAGRGREARKKIKPPDMAGKRRSRS